MNYTTKPKIFLLLLSAIILSAYTIHRQASGIPKTDLMKKWGNTYTVIEQVNGNGDIEEREVINPNGFFKLNKDMTYDRVSEGVSMNGTWSVNGKHLKLDAGGATERVFDILLLEKDSLVIQRSDGPTRYTQHYTVFNDHPRMVWLMPPLTPRYADIKLN